MVSKSRENRRSRSTRAATSNFAWMKMIPLFLAIAAGGCGLGDHGSSSDDGTDGIADDGDIGGTGPGISGFESADAVAAVAGSAGLPASAAADFCTADSLAGISEAGVRGFDFNSGDMIPLCDGWVIVANKTDERIEVRNIVTGEVDSLHDVPGMPEALELDLDLKRVYATLPEQNLVASVDLLTSELLVASTNSSASSITQNADELLVAASNGTELRVYDKATLGFIANSMDLVGNTIVYNTGPDEMTAVDDRLIAANASALGVFSYDLDAAGGTVTLSLLEDEPSTGDVLGLELSPNNERLALVIPGGNASFAGANAINDYESANGDITRGAWKVGVTPTSAGFSPLSDEDSEYLLASTADELVIFDIERHAEISRSEPSTDCSDGSFDQVAFSRGGNLALGKRNCGGSRGTEFHWMAPAAGFGDSASTIGVDLVALATVLPTVEGAPLCENDDLSAITSSSSGSLTIPESADIEPLCDGWVFVSQRSTNRVILVNVITGVTLAEWDLPDLPTELIIDEDNQYLFAALPAGSDVVRIDLAGPNRGALTDTNSQVVGSPTSITLGPPGEILVTGFFEPGELRIRSIRIDGEAMIPDPETRALEVLFQTASSQIAYDRTAERLFVSDDAGSARFELVTVVLEDFSMVNEYHLLNPDEELFDTLNSEIILASPDEMTIALVDQTADLVYDFDTGEIADLTETFWEVGSTNEITNIAFSSGSEVFGVATTNEVILFNAEGDHAELATFSPNNCSGDDPNARVGISRGATVGFYKSDCGDFASRTETIFWNEF